MRSFLSLLLSLLPVSCAGPKISQSSPNQPQTKPSQAAKEVTPETATIKVLVQPPPPAYPESARAAHIQGTVIVELLVGPDGIPISAKALDGPVELRSTAEEYALKYRFSPALHDGKPQPIRFSLHLPFKIPEH
jgi:protein TonB